MLVLDEIFAVGDLGFRKRCEERYRQLAAQGHTVILVSHEPGPIQNFCTRALLLDQGRIAREGSGPEIASAYQSLLTP